ncbi:GAF domain-containing sensor histidine kinase [Loktanella sp. M215]|uniref:GAF domain-containing sensor histidine kinase n=1 Tax=Loktanella sp. M215 TaxID=2675431 RepID=UPI001F45561A|nr:GAF domain-containing sensor histidine kinase [Loktanella sp. M215]MCF7698954.1 GAF domain-containing protein [Loktanella sp. M215]
MAKAYTFEALGLLHQGIDESILNIVKLAGCLLEAPVSHVSVVETVEGRQLIAASVGPLFDPMDHCETCLEDSICKHVVATRRTVAIPDLQKDIRTQTNSLLQAQNLRSYIGSPIHTTTGRVIGSLCCMTHTIRDWSARDIEMLEKLACCVDDIIKARTLALEERRARERLQDLLASRSSYIAHISHEIRTPLTGIIASIKMLSHAKSDRQSARLNDILTRSADKLMTFVSDVLDLAKIDAGQIESVLEETPLVDLMSDILAEFSPLAESKSVALEIDNQLGKNTYFVDRKALTTIVQNLVGNAVKFTDSGYVRVHLKEDSYGQIVIEVCDTGIGIASADHARIFEEFEQADANISRTYGGTGLGMTIVKRTVEHLNGLITVDSRLGHGAKFTVSLPLQIANGQSQAA